MNLPNKITLFRIIIIPVIMFFGFPYPSSFMPDMLCKIAVLVLFIIAEFSDMADGKIARKYNLVTDFGKFLDPVADKLLVSAALLSVCAERPIYVWVTMIILLREFVITGFRLVASGKGVVIAAGKLGKFKTVLQTTALTVLMAAPVLGYIYEPLKGIFTVVGDIIMALAVVMTIVSGVEYIVKNKNILSGSM